MAFKINDKKFRKVNKKIFNFVNNRLPKMVLKEFKDNTPRDKGNAKRNTKLKNTFKGFEVVGDYEYSGVLDRGEFPNPPKEGTGKTRGGYSTQAPKGMSDPTIDYTEKTVTKYIKRNS